MKDKLDSDPILFESPIRRDKTREGEVVSFEAVVRSENGESMFDPGVIVTPENLGRFLPSAGTATQTVRELQKLGFRILNVGAFSVSGEATRERWFGARNRSPAKRAKLGASGD